MRITCSNFLSIVICVFLICVQYFYSLPKTEYPVLSIKVSWPALSDKVTIAKVGETIEIFCTDERSDALEVLYKSKDNYWFNRLNGTKEIVNDTTMRVVISIQEQLEINVACALKSRWQVDQQITLIVDGPPNVENFRCKSNNFISLHCAWTTTTLAAGFKLYVIIDNDRPAIICDIPVHEVSSGSYYLSCPWDKTKSPRYTPEAATLNFLMEYCNYTHCLNKSFEFNHLSIVKLDPPIRLMVDGGFEFHGSKRVLFIWSIPQKTFNLLNGVDERIRYLSFGSRPREVETPDDIVIGKNVRSTLITTFILPCADRIYEIQVSVKTKQAVGEEYWSDYASVFYETKANGYFTELPDDSSCKEPDILETRETMARDLRTFHVKFKKEQLELKNKIKKLQEKVAQTDEK